MHEDDAELERLVEQRLLRVNALAFGVAAGVLAGVCLFLATNWLLLKGGTPLGPHLALLGQYFIGYRVSFGGSLIGFAYAFALAFATAYAGAWLYNRVTELRHGGPRPRA